MSTNKRPSCAATPPTLGVAGESDPCDSESGDSESGDSASGDSASGDSGLDETVAGQGPSDGGQAVADAAIPIPATPRWPAGSAEDLIRLWNEGCSAAEAAARLGLSARAVESKVRKLRVAGHHLATRRGGRPRRAQRAARRCLYCGDMFPSSHIGNRICTGCLDEGPFSGALV